jgi:hypothetical protein
MQKNHGKNEKSFEKGIDNGVSCVIIAKYEKNAINLKGFQPCLQQC